VLGRILVHAVHQIVVGSVSAGNPIMRQLIMSDSAIHRISEEPSRGLPTNVQRTPPKELHPIFAPLQAWPDSIPAGPGSSWRKRVPDAANSLLIAADRFLEKFRRRERPMVTLTWRPGLPWPLR